MNMPIIYEQAFIRKILMPLKNGKKLFALFAKAEKLTDVPLEALLDRSARIVTADEFENEVALEAANDAMIDRAFKRLVQIKGLKEMLGHNSQNEGASMPKRVERRVPKNKNNNRSQA